MTISDIPAFRMQGITKRFGSTTALDDVDFACNHSEIHAILGENGAGKSTLIKLISGVLQPTSGQMFLEGKPIELPSPRAALDHGLVCMFQELSLVPDLTVRENLLLGDPGSGIGFLKSDSLDVAVDVLNHIDGASIRMASRVSDLSLAARQQVEIAKAMMRKPRVLMLDEATSALNASVVEKVFDLVRASRDSGTSILFISHRFHEIEALADRISVFRNGRRVETFENRSRDYADIVNLMVGQRIEDLFPPKPKIRPEAAELIRVDGFGFEDQVKDVSLTLKEGQITGLGGLDGQGQRTFLQGLFGLLSKFEGNVSLEGNALKAQTPKSAKQAEIGLAYIPEDRKTEGLIQEQSIAENLELAAIGRKDIKADDPALYKDFLDALELKHGGLELPVSSLSGGNQQKVVLAKWLAVGPRCLLLDDPTRGIDVKTKTQIYKLLRHLADQGKSIVLLSTDYEELVQLCDEAHIFYGGRIVETLIGDRITAQNIIAASLNLGAAAEGAHV
nr:sugar ABC transporter ATP-binding protein [uncultured Cohaesibacter sp.]